MTPKNHNHNPAFSAIYNAEPRTPNTSFVSRFTRSLITIFIIHHSSLIIASASIPTPIRYEIERSRPQLIRETSRRGESIDLQITFRDYGAPVDLSNASNVLLHYRPQETNLLYQVQGDFLSRTNGSITIPWRANHELTSNRYLFEIIVTSGSSTMTRAYGTWTLTDSVGYQSTATNSNSELLLWSDGMLALTRSTITNACAGLYLPITATNDIIGQPGPQGEQGPIGPQGPAGINGTNGATGPQGPQGEQGPIGLTGPQGPQGPAGTNGVAGPQGSIGPQGPAGTNGTDGAIGPQGPIGPIGPQGPTGTIDLAILNGYLPLSGGTLTGSVHSTVDHTSEAPSSTELVTAGWVRSLLDVGTTLYITGITNTSANLGESTFQMLPSIPATGSRSYTVLSNAQYMGSVMTTGKYSGIQGPFVIHSYVQRIGNTTFSIKPEIYFTTNGIDLQGDWDTAGQAIATGTNLYSYVISVPQTTFPQPAYILRRWKVTAYGGGSAPTMIIHYGTNTPSHLSWSIPASTFTASDITALGGLTNNFNAPATFSTNLTVGGTFSGAILDPVHQVLDLLPFLNNGTITVTRAMGAYLGLTLNTNTVIVSDLATFPSNHVATFSLCLFPGVYSVTWGSGMSNTLSLTASSTNNIIFHKGCFWSRFLGRGSAAP